MRLSIIEKLKLLKEIKLLSKQLAVEQSLVKKIALLKVLNRATKKHAIGTNLTGSLPELNAAGNEIARKVPGQPTWVDFELPELKHTDDTHRLTAPDPVEESSDIHAAYQVLLKAFGLGDAESTVKRTVAGDILVERDKLMHIVEKRTDARERYVNFALTTLEAPYEVWKVAYDDGSYRYSFIGMFKHKRQMLVVVKISGKKILWNFMHTSMGSLNKHRNGELIYQRHK